LNNPAQRRVLLYVQHLLGIGHLQRTAILARACAAAGLEVTLVSGGMPVPDLPLGDARFVQLPPTVATDPSFKVLIDADGHPVDEAWKARRRDLLLELWRTFKPHALVIELYPFGRRLMRFELLPLLEAAKAAVQRPLIVSSARDVLQDNEDNAARLQKMIEAFERYFDWALVHGDPAFIPFERTFPHAPRIAAQIAYTGYVVDSRRTEDADATANVNDARDDGSGEVLVSAGGGAFGGAVLETAIRARAHTVLADRLWRVRAGVSPAPARIEALQALAARSGRGRVIVEANQPDFRHRLRHCALSISQAGYNTLLETLQANARAVMVPYVGRKETEQTLRARLLAERGAIDIVEESALSVDALAAAVDRAVKRPRADRVSIDMDGAARSAALLRQWTEALTW
jgi:predicted glycosyltransferase